MLKAELRVISGKQLGTLIPLKQAKFLVGREQDCDLRPNSEMVSRHHCVFSVDDFTVRVRDLGSTNGTLVNGERSRSTVVLKPGDRVTIGKLDFIVVINGDAGVALEETVLAGASDATISPASAQASTRSDVTKEGVGSSADPAESAPVEDTSATMLDFTVPTLDETAASTDTQSIEGDTQFMPVPGPPQQTPVSHPVGQPTQYPPQQYPPQQYPQQQYPPQPGMYPPPGYPQMPQGYPPGYPYPYPGYPPQQQYYPYPPQQAPAPAAPEGPAPPPAPSTSTDANIDVRLPDPKTTGAKAPLPPEPPKEGPADGKKPAHIPTAAGDIIAQYLGRRPNSGTK